MNRRHFSKLFASAMMTLGISTNRNQSLNKTRPLKKGDTVALVTPSGPIKKDRLLKTKSLIESLGFKVYHTEAVLFQNGHLAGTDKQRLDDLHHAFQNNKVDAIWAIRGGYGATRYLDLLDFELIRKNPKPLIGYSDITALLNTIFQHTGNPCFHGPIAGASFTEYSRAGLTPLFSSNPVSFDLSVNNITKGETDSAYKYRVIIPGKATGPLAGGNLSLLTATVGTKHQVASKGKIIFIEDIGEEPYRIDRMFTQLISAGFFDQAKGIILGVFADCEKKDFFSSTLQETIDERIKHIGLPCIYGFSFGHIDDKCTFPIGVQASFDTNYPKIHILGSAFSE